jgi:hypothetical protein
LPLGVTEKFIEAPRRIDREVFSAEDALLSEKTLKAVFGGEKKKRGPD